MLAISIENPIEEVGHDTAKLVLPGVKRIVGRWTTEIFMILELAVAPEVVVVRAEIA